MSEIKRRKIGRPLVALLFLLLLYFLAKNILLPTIIHFHNINLSSDELKRGGAIVKGEYISLFTEQAQKRLKISNNWITKSQYPFSSIEFNNHYYELFIHKVISNHDIALSEIIKIEKKTFKFPADGITAGSDFGDIQFAYSSEHDSLVNNICVSYADSLLDKSIRGDSVVNYVFLTKSLSFRYDINGRQAWGFLSKQPSIFEPKPRTFYMSVTVYKRKTDIFIVVLFTRNKNIKIDNFTLLELLDFNQL